MKNIWQKISKIALLSAFIPLPSGKTSWDQVEISDIEGMAKAAINGFLGVLGAIGVVVIIWGAIQYLTAYGNEEKAQRAKSTILWAVVGIVVAMLCAVIVNLVWTTLTGNPAPTTIP